MSLTLEAALPEDRPPAVDVALAVENRRREATIKALTTYRLLVEAVADGAELNAKRVGDLADAADRLRLPVGSLEADVATLRNHRGNVTLLAQRRQDAEELRLAAEIANKEIENLERRLKECRWTIQKHRNIESQPAGIVRAIDEMERENPRLFGAVDVAVGRLEVH